MELTALCPSEHSPITSTLESCASRLLILLRASGSSSTIRARIFVGLPSRITIGVAGLGSERNAQAVDQAATSSMLQFEAVFSAVKITHAGPCVGQPDAFLQRLVTAESGSIIFDLESQQ